MEADLVGCRAEAEALCQVLETISDRVEPHGWGAAYVDMGDGLARNRAGAVGLCQKVGRSVRGALSQNLQPALGWNSNKFTAQTAARHTPPGHLRAVERAGEQSFLRPLPVTLLPLAQDSLQRLQYLGLRTLGQYAALPRAAVWQQFGRAGIVARRCARGRDDRPVVPRGQAPRYTAGVEFELPLAERSRLVAALVRLVSPLLANLRDTLQACGQVRLAVHFDDGSAQERVRSFLLPVAGERRVVEALGHLLDEMHWPAPASALAVTLARIQDIVAEQLALFAPGVTTPADTADQEKGALGEVERYLTTRFGPLPSGGSRLQQPVLVRPGAPLPEWRAGWLEGGQP
jgi:nucleotidyltransferase/DNA polymerase involved in DNA repair